MEVHQHDIWSKSYRQIQGFLTIRGLTDNMKVGTAIDKDLQRMSHESVVIGDQHPDLFHPMKSIWLATGRAGGIQTSRKTIQTYAALTSSVL